LGINEFVVIGGGWWWHKTGWSLWINFRFLLGKVQKIITILSIDWHQWFFQLSVNKFVIIGGSWWWHKTGWSLWVNFVFLLA
jgi:hypothetical protein